MPSYPHLTETMRELLQRANKLGLTATIESSTGMAMTIKLGSGVRVVMAADLGINSSAACRLCYDKYFAADLLNQAGLNTLESKIVHLHDDLNELAGVEYPCVVKPNKGLGGEGLLAVNTVNELAAAIRYAQTHDKQVLIQKFHTGREFRIVVLDGELLYGYEKRAWQICGDGVRSIEDFINHYNAQVSPNNVVPLHDVALVSGLQHAGITLATVLRKDEVFNVFVNANLKKGAQSFPVEKFADEYIDVVVNACTALGLRYGGVDLFATHPEVFDQKYRIIEVNANPGFQFLRDHPDLHTKVLDSLSVALFQT